MRPDALAGAAPIVAILRGVTPERCRTVADAIHAAGIRTIEVPLNSPRPFDSVEILRAHFAGDCLIGAGTVLTVEDVLRTEAAGGRIIVAPNCNAEVIRSALQRGLDVLPGIATATEAFAAIEAGATSLKLFPAATYGPRHLKALGAVLPAGVRIVAVGGIGASDVREWLEAGAAGFGFGSELFHPEMTEMEVGTRARLLVSACREAQRSLTGHRTEMGQRQ